MTANGRGPPLLFSRPFPVGSAGFPLLRIAEEWGPKTRPGSFLGAEPVSGLARRPSVARVFPGTVPVSHLVHAPGSWPRGHRRFPLPARLLLCGRGGEPMRQDPHHPREEPGRATPARPLPPEARRDWPSPVSAGHQAPTPRAGLVSASLPPRLLCPAGIEEHLLEEEAVSGRRTDGARPGASLPHRRRVRLSS